MFCSKCGNKLEDNANFCTKCGKKVAGNTSSGTFTDPRDGKTYKTVKIGEQTWMAQNFAFDYAGSKVYGNDLSNLEKYGRLYDWETANKACPAGWHLPTEDEWATLIAFVGGSEIAGKKLKANDDWRESGNGTDDFGFAALPSGLRHPEKGFVNIGATGFWWSSTEDDDNESNAWSRWIGYKSDESYRFNRDKSSLSSVRYIQGVVPTTAQPSQNSTSPRGFGKDNETSGEGQENIMAAKKAAKGATGTFTDKRDGKVYKTVTIGKQTWMAENLAYDTEEADSWYYDDDPANGEKYGKLYTWDAAERGTCPLGWHLPSEKEWQALIKFAGGSEIAGKKLKAKSGWEDYEGKSCNGTDDFGFAALPGGSGYDCGDFKKVGYRCEFWSATEDEDNYESAIEVCLDDSLNIGDIEKQAMLSIRCIKD